MNPDEKEFQNLDMPFSTPSAAGVDVPLSSSHRRITYKNQNEYIRLALQYRYYCLFFLIILKLPHFMSFLLCFL